MGVSAGVASVQHGTHEHAARKADCRAAVVACRSSPVFRHISFARKLVDYWLWTGRAPCGGLRKGRLFPVPSGLGRFSDDIGCGHASSTERRGRPAFGQRHLADQRLRFQRRHCEAELRPARARKYQRHLTIEPGASVVVEGSVDGKVFNKGGRLVVNNRGVAEFARTEGPPEAEAGGILRIDLTAIVSNWELLAKRTDAECAAVVKADAYGCGIDPVTATLKEVGCKTFFVSNLAEAKRVRLAAPNAVIYVLNGFYGDTGPVFAEIDARPVINNLIEMAAWDAFVAGTNWTGGFAVNVDTGSSRLGLTMDEAAGIAQRIRTSNHGVKLLMSRLENAAQPDHPLNHRQQVIF